MITTIVISLTTGLVHEFILLSWIIPTLTTHAYFSWLYAFTITFVISCIISLWFICFGVLIHYTVKKPAYLFVLPFFWVVLEWTRQFGPLAFPWELLGYSQYRCLHLIQIADCLGVYGVSGLIMLMNVCLFILLLFVMNIRWQQIQISRHLALYSLVIAMVSLTATIVYGSIKISQVDKNKLKRHHKSIMTVQPAIPQQEKWDGEKRIAITQKMLQLTNAGRKGVIDLVVWPETALPYAIHSKHDLRHYVLNAIKQMHVGLLLGSPTFLNNEKQTVHYNSALLIDKKGKIISRYDKAKLVPFSEHMPFPALHHLWRLLGAPDNKFSSGCGGDVHYFHELHMGIQICFEIIFPQLSRKMVHNGANVLINISNDAWFGQTACTYQHFSMAVFRAVENKRAVVRCANTGISGMIDPCGRIISQSKLFETNTMIHHVPLLNSKTVYSCLGDIFAGISLLLSLVFIVRIKTKS